MYNNDDIGDPYGTPAGVDIHLDFVSLNWNCVFLSYGKLAIHDEIL
jgi:hypothetical protein